MRASKILMLAGVLFVLGAVAPASASAQCHYPAYGGAYYVYPGYYHHHHHYPVYAPVYRHHLHHHRYPYRRRYWY